MKIKIAKRVFLYVTGGDYSALDFETNFNEQKIYEEMVREGVKSKVLKDDEYYIEIYIKEFEEIDSKFIDFVKDTIMDYDDSKNSDFYEVESL